MDFKLNTKLYEPSVNFNFLKNSEWLGETSEIQKRINKLGLLLEILFNYALKHH